MVTRSALSPSREAEIRRAGGHAHAAASMFCAFPGRKVTGDLLDELAAWSAAQDQHPSVTQVTHEIYRRDYVENWPRWGARS